MFQRDTPLSLLLKNARLISSMIDGPYRSRVPHSLAEHSSGVETKIYLGWE
jgi:hypothetical protein